MGKFYIPVTTGMICRITFSVITVVSGCFRSSIVISVSCIFGSSFVSISSSNFFSRSIQITSPVRMNAKVKAYDWNFELYLIYLFPQKWNSASFITLNHCDDDLNDWNSFRSFALYRCFGLYIFFDHESCKWKMQWAEFVIMNSYDSFRVLWLSLV